jgi:hypothetical protein
VVEERRVHRLAHLVVPAEREREVRDASRDERSRTTLLEERDRLDECLREAGVLLDPRRDGEDVRVEDDVLGANPAVPIRRSYARPRISTLRSTVSPARARRTAMTTTAAP